MLSKENSTVMIRHLGRRQYQPVVEAMRTWTHQRSVSTADEIWVLEHFPVYTRGVSCRDEPRYLTRDILVVDSDRGGQITYHGPGQIVLYLLLDLRRLRLGIQGLVSLIEQKVIGLLHEHKVVGSVEDGAPGVYVSGSKVAAIGFRIRKNCCYHGLSLNVDMDLTPFQSINPCGYPGLQVTQLRELGIDMSFSQAWQRLVDLLIEGLHYREMVVCEPELPDLTIQQTASQKLS